MSTRGIHLHRVLFSVPTESKTIPDQGLVKFTDEEANFYKRLIIDGAISHINKIEYNYNTHAFRINTSLLTYNTFIIYWAVCLKTANSMQMPCFSVIVKDADNNIVTTLPGNTTRRSTVVYGNCLLTLPKPTILAPMASYYLSLVNTTGGECYYSTKAIYIADIIIVCVDDN